MAPVSDRIYFPSLGECLTGEQVVISWKLAATALSDATGQRQTSAAIIDFFDDEHVHDLLKDPSRVFPLPNETSKKEFEAKTAPINVTPGSDDRYDLKTIKDDAEWLSKNAKISLVAALRVVVTELQARPCIHLNGPLSSQDATNLQEAAGVERGQGSSLVADLGGGAALDAEEIWADFEKNDARRRRIFEIYLIERRSHMMVAEYALSIRLYGRLPILTTPIETKLAQVYRLKLQQPAREELDLLLSNYLQAVSDRMSSIESGLSAQTDDALLCNEVTELEWLRTLLTEAVHTLSAIFQVVDAFGNDFAPSNAVNRWFTLMDMFSFFDRLQPINEAIAELIMPLKTLSAAISLILLKPERALTYLIERDEDAAQADAAYDSYLLSNDVLEQIHKSLMNAAAADSESACPVIFAWAVLLHQLNLSYQSRTEKRDNLLQQNARETFETGVVARPTMARRNSAGSIFSIESSKFDGFLENQIVPKDLSVVEQLAAGVTAQGRVYAIVSRMSSLCGASARGSMTLLVGSRLRTVFVELLKVTYPFVGYQSEPLEALVSVLSGERSYWDISPGDTLTAKQDVVASALDDNETLEFYFQQTIDRYPYEFLPFITMCRILASTTCTPDDDRSELLLGHLRKTPTLTFILPDAFMNYELVQEDENTNTFCILQDIPLISLSSSWQRRTIEDDAFRIPSGTFGRFITDSGRVVVMEYPHSTLSLLGRRLEINLAKEGYRAEFGMLQPEEVAEVVALFATLIRVETVKVTQENGSGALVQADTDILHEASKYISGGRDLITVVCDTLDHYMQDELAMSDDVSVSVLNSCIQFLDAVLPIQPSRIWSYLARSELLNSESRAGKLTKITGNLDLMSDRFEFLTSSMRFFSALIHTASSSAVQRRTGNKLAPRQRDDLNPWSGTSDKVLARVSLSIVQAAVDVFENTSTWKFEDFSARTRLLDNVVPILNHVVLYAYSMGSPKSDETMVSCLRPAAMYIIDCFLSPNTGTLRFQPLLTTFISALTMADGSTLYARRRQISTTQVLSVLSFSATLLRAADLLEKQSNMLETYLFKISTLLARLCGASDFYRSSAVWLLDSLVSKGGRSSNDPPSLLGYLGPQISKSFLHVLAGLSKPFVLTADVQATWRFFSSVLRNRQQWMSNCLLTGQTPREAMRDTAKKELSPHSLFATALARLKSLSTLDQSEAVVILDFVASAQNYWPWTVFTLQKDTKYLDGLRAYVRELKPSHQVAKTNVTKASFEARIAAYVAETLAMQLYHSRHLGNGSELAKGLVMDLDYYLRDGVEVAGYNKSLHTNFAKNFTSKYSGCTIESFRRTSLEPRELGPAYFYDLPRADEMLRFDPAWVGRKKDGFKTEMELANANLSLVDAQIALFHGWQFLLLELSNCLPDSENIARQMMQVSQQCLNANQGVPGPESIFLKLVYSRADLALVLIQRLAKAKIRNVKDVDQLLGTIVGTIQAVSEPYADDSVEYYRTLLKSLYVTLRAYQFGGAGDGEKWTDGPTVSVTQTILNILDRVVARGFRLLVSFVHEDDVDVSPEDLGLLTAILQACLSLPTVDQSQTQIMNIMAAHDAVHAATSLFSWADKLTIQGDPVYGELSILFLLELSALPLVAEQLAADGIVNSLISSNLMKFMLKANLSPYAETPMAQRCYSIWAKGLLPLLLNLLIALGPSVASEVAYVLNLAPHLIQTSVDRFEAPGVSRTRSSSPHYITLLATSEVHSLALLTRILNALRVNNSRDIPEISWDASSMLENVEFWLSGKKLLKERLMPLGAREIEWRATKPTAAAAEIGCDNLLEEKVVSQLEAVRAVLGEELDGE